MKLLMKWMFTNLYKCIHIGEYMFSLLHKYLALCIEKSNYVSNIHTHYLHVFFVFKCKIYLVLNLHLRVVMVCLGSFLFCVCFLLQDSCGQAEQLIRLTAYTWPVGYKNMRSSFPQRPLSMTLLFRLVNLLWHFVFAPYNIPHAYYKCIPSLTPLITDIHTSSLLFVSIIYLS